MKIRWIVIASAATILLVGEAWLLVASPQNAKHQPTLPTSPLAQATPPPASAAAKRAVVAPTIGLPTATPAIITVNTPTTVTVTAQINPAPLAGGVNLLRLGATGTQPTILGVMHDDGLNGDAVAGDGRYTLEYTFTEASFGQIYFEASAAFAGQLRRSASAPLSVPVWNTVSSPSAAVSFSLPVPSGWTTAEGSNVISFFPPGKSADPTSEYAGDYIAYIDPNPTNLPITSYYNGNNGPDLYDDSSIVNTTMVDGITAYQFALTAGIDATDVTVVPVSGGFLRFEDRGDPTLYTQILQLIKTQSGN